MEVDIVHKQPSRPSSLILDNTLQPEKEPLRFEINLVGAPPELAELIRNIQHVAEQNLYHWKTFPIVLPKSVCLSDSEVKRMSELFIIPNVNELEDAALDESGKHRKLTQRQLHDIKERGEFEVVSRHFPGWCHVWRVSSLLQRGRQRAKDDLYKLLAQSLAFIIIYAKRALITKQPFSVYSGIKSLKIGLHRILDMVFGMPSLAPLDLERKIREERSRYLVAELMCYDANKDDISAVAWWVARSLRGETPHSRPLPPTQYTTPCHVEIDLRLFRRDIMKQAAPTLSEILERESRGWYLHFRERLATELTHQKTPPEQIEEEVRSASMREYVGRVCAAVRANSTLRALGEPIPKLLADQLQATVICNRAVERARLDVERVATAGAERARAACPVRGRLPAWRREKAAIAARAVRNRRPYDAHVAAAAAAENKLPMHHYFLLRDLAFLKEREPVLRQELRKAVHETRTFSWRRHKFSWPCIARDREVNARDTNRCRQLGARDHVTTTRYLGWRWNNYLHRCWCWTFNMMFFLGVLIPWCSPLSMRSLFRCYSFTPEYELSQVNSKLFTRQTAQTETVWSRLRALWRHISKERTRYDSKPDTGFLGREMNRHIHRISWYAIGITGTIGLVVILPIVILVGSTLSAIFAVFAPLWVPCVALAYHLLMLVFYDFDCPNPARRNRWCLLGEAIVWRVGIMGVLKMVVAAVTGAILCPIAAVLYVTGGAAWWTLRRCWEAATLRALASRARVPARDSAYCRRIAGPGLHSPYCYQLSAVQAAAAMCSVAERDAARHWATELSTLAEKPLRDYRRFVTACFAPFSLRIAETGAYKQLEKECSELRASIQEQLECRLRDLDLGFTEDVRKRIKLSHQDLQRVLNTGWDTLSGIGRGMNIAPNRCKLLVDAIDAEVLTPLEPTAARLPLAWARPGDEAKWRAPAPPPDLLPAPPAPRVPPPALSLSAFDVRPHYNSDNNCETNMGLPIPLPIPTPTTVAIIIYNRDAENPIPLDSERCVEIIRVLDDLTQDDQEYIGTESSTRCLGDSLSSASSEWSHDGARGDTGTSSGWPLAPVMWPAGSGGDTARRVELASPEDITLEAEIAPQPTTAPV